MATVNCPHCNNSLNVPENLAGMQVTCPICNQVFTAGQAPAPQAPVFTPARTSSPAVSGGSGSAIGAILGGLALIVAVVALVLQLMAPSVPYLKFKKDPKDAVEAMIKARIQGRSFGSYFYREHGDEILDSFKVAEVKESGSFAAVFYTLSRGATTVKRVAYLERNSDGYYVEVSESKLPKEWLNSISSQIDKFTKDSGSWSDFEK